MHRDSFGHLVGAAGENISINASTPTSGTLQLSFGGTILGPPPQTVQFEATGSIDLVATLTGPPGSQCAISIANVDGGTDTSILSVGAGTFHDTEIIEFVTAAASSAAFADAGKPEKNAPKKAAKKGSKKG